MKMELTECSETSAHTIQKPGDSPKEIIQNSEHGGSLKSRRNLTFVFKTTLINCKTSNSVSKNLRKTNTIKNVPV
jgi:hypothetical protein